MLRQSDPFLGTVDKALVLPDRNVSLEVVDEPTACCKGLGPMGRRRCDHDGKIADLEGSGSMVSRQVTFREVLANLGNNPLELVLGEGVR